MTVVITGGTGALGTALAERLVRKEANLAITYVVPEEAAAFEERINLDEDRLMLRRVDATSRDELDAFVAEAADELGPITGLCALVGGWAGGRDIDETDDLRFDRMIDLNIRSAFYSVRAAIPYLKKAEWGRIVLVGSRAAEDPPAGQATFNLAKAGVVALGKSAAAELTDTEITANVVMPSVIDTPATREALPYAEYVQWPTPDEIAAVIEFLLSKESQVISGATVSVTGRTKWTTS